MTFNWEVFEGRVLENLGGGWRRECFDCPECGEEGGIEVQVHYTDKQVDALVPHLTKCKGCGAPVETPKESEV